MSKSIFFKLFVITTIGVVLFIGIMMFVQSAFFEKYYIYKKTKLIQDELKNLKGAFANTNIYSDALNIADEFSSRTGSFTLFLETTDKKNQINRTNVGVTSLAGNNIAIIDDNFIKEKIAYGREIYQRNKVSMDEGKSILYNTEDKYGNKYIATVASIVSGNINKGLLLIFTSLQPVGEASGIIQDYYVLFFIAAILLVVLLSYLYSRQISKPLIHLNKITSKIAEFDFSIECNIKSRDELGNLSSTINRLSRNIQSYVTRLSDSNRLLQKELEKEKALDVMRNEFVAGASHELKTPITIIKGYLQGLQDKIERGEQVTEYLEILNEETSRMNAIVTDMLDLSRLQSGKAGLSMEPISLNHFIKYIIKKMSSQISEKGFIVHAAEIDESLLVMGDTLRIEQVFVNLLNNAFKYTPDKGIINILVIDLKDRCMIEIENSGSNIPEEESNKIWEKFYRLEKSRNKSSGGTGLGLSIVKNILELHESQFGVKNTDSGVKFFFSLKKYTENCQEYLLTNTEGN